VTFGDPIGVGFRRATRWRLLLLCALFTAVPAALATLPIWGFLSALPSSKVTTTTWGTPTPYRRAETTLRQGNGPGLPSAGSPCSFFQAWRASEIAFWRDFSVASCRLPSTSERPMEGSSSVAFTVTIRSSTGPFAKTWSANQRSMNARSAPASTKASRRSAVLGCRKCQRS
jgi:hypothetical protein